MDQSDGQGQGSRGRQFRVRPLRSGDAPKLWDARDVADVLNLSTSWVYKAAAEGLLPVVRLPGCTRLRFDPEMIRAYARGEWKPATVIPLKAG